MNNLSNILKWLSNFEDKETRDKYLENKGYDVGKTKERGAHFIKKQLAEVKLKQARRKKALLEKAKNLVDKSNVDVQNLLNDTNQSSGFAYQFSKHENISEEDKLDMLNDEQLLHIIEKIKKKHDE